MTLIFEGTWEEIKLHEAELAGRHVKVTVEREMTEEETQADTQRRLAAWKRLAKMAVSGATVDDSREKIYENDVNR